MAHPAPAEDAVRVVDLDDPDSVSAFTALSGAAEHPHPIVNIGVSVAGLPDARYGDLVSRLSLTLVPAVAGSGDRRTVAVDEPWAEAARLAGLVAARPAASRTLDGLLRVVETVPEVSAAVVVESLAYSTLLAGAEFGSWLARHRRRAVEDRPVEPVRLDRADGCLRIELADPDRRNAFSAALRDALVEALALPLLDDTITRVEVSGAGPTFSSGGDLDEFGTVTDPPIGHAVRLEASAGLAVHMVRERVTARVHGRCVGAGVEVPAFAGHVVAAPGTTFRLPEVAMGLVPGAGGTVSVSRRIGRWRTAYLCLSGLELDADAALAWGLVDAVG